MVTSDPNISRCDGLVGIKLSRKHTPRMSAHLKKVVFLQGKGHCSLSYFPTKNIRDIFCLCAKCVIFCVDTFYYAIRSH